MVKGKSTRDSDKMIRLLEDFVVVTKRWIDVIEGKASLEELKQVLTQGGEEKGVEVKIKAPQKRGRAKKGGKRRKKG